MKKVTYSLCFFAAACALSSTVANADTLGLNGGWFQQVQIMNPGDYFSTFYTATDTEAVDITGFYYTGDYYRVTVNGNTVLTTSPVGTPNQDLGDANPQYQNPGDASFTSGLFSTGTFYVNPNDVIVVYDLAPPLGIGEVGVQATATPEPTALPLLGAGLLAAAAAFRKRGFNAPRCLRK